MGCCHRVVSVQGCDFEFVSLSEWIALYSLRHHQQGFLVLKFDVLVLKFDVTCPYSGDGHVGQGL